MILVIDTSAPRASFVATIDGGQREEHQAPRLDLEALRKLARERPPAKVAVATGPGSFTGLRVGVSFGLGLAMGLRIPILALPTLELPPAGTVSCPTPRSGGSSTPPPRSSKRRVKCRIVISRSNTCSRSHGRIRWS